MTSNAHSENSSFREKVLEYLFVAEVLRYLWQRGIVDAEVLFAEVDNAGYDVVIDCNGVMRHIQLKASHSGAATSKQNANLRLQSKPSGCIVWLVFDLESLSIDKFLWFGAEPGAKLPDITSFRTAKHSKANAQGLKLERPNIRIVPRGKFEELKTLSELVEKMFGVVKE